MDPVRLNSFKTKVAAEHWSDFVAYMEDGSASEAFLKRLDVDSDLQKAVEDAYRLEVEDVQRLLGGTVSRVEGEGRATSFWSGIGRRARGFRDALPAAIAAVAVVASVAFAIIAWQVSARNDRAAAAFVMAHKDTMKTEERMAHLQSSLYGKIVSAETPSVSRTACTEVLAEFARSDEVVRERLVAQILDDITAPKTPDEKRVACADLLGEISVPADLSVLVKRLNSKNGEAVNGSLQMAINQVGRRYPDRSLAPLVEIARNTNFESGTRKWAVNTLGLRVNLAQANAVSPDLDDAGVALIDLWGAADPALKSEAVEVVTVWSQSKNLSQKGALALVGKLESPDEPTSRAAFRALVHMGDAARAALDQAPATKKVEQVLTTLDARIGPKANGAIEKFGKEPQ